MKLLIPTRDNSGLDSRVFGHLPMASYFTIVEVNDQGQIVNFKQVKNEDAEAIIEEHSKEALEHSKHDHNEHENGQGGGRRVLPKIVELAPDVIFVTQIGPGAVASMKTKGIKILKVKGHMVKEVIEEYLKGNVEEYVP